MIAEELIFDNKTLTDCYLVQTMEEFLNLTKELQPGRIFICGGLNIYKEAIEKYQIDKLYINTIDLDYQFDNSFDTDTFAKMTCNYVMTSIKDLEVLDQNTKRDLFFTK